MVGKESDDECESRTAHLIRRAFPLGHMEWAAGVGELGGERRGAWRGVARSGQEWRGVGKSGVELRKSG